MAEKNNLLLVGLGNPGDKYVNTRHNIGFRVVDSLAKDLVWTKKHLGLIAQTDYGYLLKPQTFMNDSGKSVKSVANFYKISLGNVIVIHDDLDLPLGKVRIKYACSSGGHNGLKSIDQYISKDYIRVKIGIGKPEDKSQVLNYVLGDFSEAEQLICNFLVDFLTQNVKMLLEYKHSELMNAISLAFKEQFQQNDIDK